MITKREVFGTHAFFAREGAAFTVPANGTVSATAKPGPTDTSWNSLGTADWKIKRERKRVDFMKPAPGKRVLGDVITVSDGMTLTGKCYEMQNFSWEMLLGTLELPASPAAGGQYNPLEGVDIKGWLKIQQYNRANTLINTMDVWIDIAVDGDVDFGENPTDMDVTCKVLWSALNTGTLT